MKRFIVLILISLTINCHNIASSKNNEASHIPSNSKILKGYSQQQVKSRLDEIGIQPIEGIWHYTEENTTIAIERIDHSIDNINLAYQIVYLESDTYDILPGTIIGYIENTVKNNKFTIHLYSERNKNILLTPVECTATLSDDSSTLTFEHRKLKFYFRINIARFLPAFFKGISIIPDIEGESAPIGFKKIYPAADENSSSHSSIRYL